MGFAAAERIGYAVERQVTQPQFDHKFQAAVYLHEQAPGDLPFVIGPFEAFKKGKHFVQRNIGQLGNIFPADPHAQGLAAQTPTVAGGAYGAAAVARQGHAVLDFVCFALQLLEKSIDSRKPFVAGPKQFLFGFAELFKGFVHRKLEPVGIFEQGGQPFAVLLAFPGSDGAVVHGFGFVRYYFIGVDTQNPAIAFAGGASTVRVVVIEQLGGGFGEFDSIQFEAVVKVHGRPGRFIGQLYPAFAFALIKSRIDGVAQPHPFAFFRLPHHEAIDQYGQAAFAKQVSWF